MFKKLHRNELNMWLGPLSIQTDSQVFFLVGLILLSASKGIFFTVACIIFVVKI